MPVGHVGRERPDHKTGERTHIVGTLKGSPAGGNVDGASPLSASAHVDGEVAVAGKGAERAVPSVSARGAYMVCADVTPLGPRFPPGGAHGALDNPHLERDGHGIAFKAVS
jgi:hypothetical protein